MKTKEKLFKALGALLRVSNLESPRSGREVANQFVIEYENGRVFQSYRSLIAVNVNGKFYFDEDYHDYSNTTAKYCTQFCGMTTKERRQAVASGVSEYVSLN